jgi:hypothetical protein
MPALLAEPRPRSGLDLQLATPNLYRETALWPDLVPFRRRSVQLSRKPTERLLRS